MKRTKPKPNGRWTLESRRKQAEMIHRWRPWEHSTGPRTFEGKRIVSLNAMVHGQRSQFMAADSDHVKLLQVLVLEKLERIERMLEKHRRQYQSKTS